MHKCKDSVSIVGSLSTKLKRESKRSKKLQRVRGNVKLNQWVKTCSTKVQKHKEEHDSARIAYSRASINQTQFLGGIIGIPKMEINDKVNEENENENENSTMVEEEDDNDNACTTINDKNLFDSVQEFH